MIQYLHVPYEYIIPYKYRYFIIVSLTQVAHSCSPSLPHPVQSTLHTFCFVFRGYDTHILYSTATKKPV